MSVSEREKEREYDKRAVSKREGGESDTYKGRNIQISLFKKTQKIVVPTYRNSFHYNILL